MKQDIRALLIDLDGTLFHGGAPVPGGLEFMQEVRGRGIPHLFLTNNSTRSPEEVAQFLQSLGYRAEPEEVYTSAVAAADHLARLDCGGLPVYLIGESGLREAFSRAGIDWTQQAVPEAAAVVAGLDRNVDYARLAVATRLLHGGALLVGTNADRVFPVDGGLAPGAGAIVALLEVAGGKPATMIGKPSASFIRAACGILGVEPGQAAVVGDNPLTDVAAGRAAGAYTVLVRTGVHAAIGADGPVPDETVSVLTEFFHRD